MMVSLALLPGVFVGGVGPRQADWDAKVNITRRPCEGPIPRGASSGGWSQRPRTTISAGGYGSLRSQGRRLGELLRRVADQDVDLAVVFVGARDQRLDCLAARDVAGDDMGIAARLVDTVGNLLAGVGLAAGDHHPGAKPGQQFGRGTADAAARTGDDGDLAGEIERGVFHEKIPFVVPRCASAHRGCAAWRT